jgi:hypothetical protein
VRAHLVSYSAAIYVNHGGGAAAAHQITPLLTNDYGFNIPSSNNGLVSPLPTTSHKKSAFLNGGLGTLSSHGSVLIKNQ